jgi:hypothetical protein
MLPLALLAAAAASSALAQNPAPPVCKPFAKLGCYFVPSQAPEGRSKLLVYHRGWWNGNGQIPPEQCDASAKQAFAFYQLDKAASAAGAVALVTCSSHLGVSPGDLAALEKATDRKFSGTILAAHSGGYVGLGKTLDAGVSTERIVMLDNFYLDQGLSKKIYSSVYGGAACTGFYTAHNKKGYETNFKPIVPCDVDYHEDYGHEGAVLKCLPTYVKKGSCP